MALHGLKPMFWIWIWSDPELFGQVGSESASRIIVLDPDPLIDSHLLAPCHVLPTILSS
jgi:hypothetical protein